MHAPVVFLHACQYPGGLLDRMPQPTWRSQDRAPEAAADAFGPVPGPAHTARARTAALIGSRFPSRRRIELWAGDRIYIDAAAGLFEPSAGSPAATADAGASRTLAARRHREALVRAYDTVDRWPFPTTSSTRVRQGCAIDDHEIVDNWEPSAHPDRRKALGALRDAGVKVFKDRRGASWPANALWGSGTWHHIRAFVFDTRTEREHRSVSSLAHAHIVGKEQRGAFERWLGDRTASAYGFRLALSPSILLPRRLETAASPASALRSDAWDGYPASLHWLLALLAEKNVDDVIFLSGDEHLACGVEAEVTRLDNQTPTARLWSVHTSAMYAPYPFANGRPEHFADETSFDFEHNSSNGPGRYRCTLRHVGFGPVDTAGFVTVDLDRRGSSGGPCATFHAAAGPAEDVELLPG